MSRGNQQECLLLYEKGMTARMVTAEDLRTAVTERMRRQCLLLQTGLITFNTLFFLLWNININNICKKKSVYSSDETQSTIQVYNQNSQFSGFSEIEQEFFPP